jgi:hypothetical protein
LTNTSGSMSVTQSGLTANQAAIFRIIF